MKDKLFRYMIKICSFLIADGYAKVRSIKDIIYFII